MPTPATNMIYSDLTQFPLLAILAHVLRGSNFLLWIVYIPILSISYVVKKLSKSPFLSQHMNCKTPKLHPVQIEHIRNFHPKAYHKASAFLQQQGFETLLDVEDVSMSSNVIQHLAWHPGKCVLTTLHLHKQSGRINYATFSAFFKNNLFLALSNTYALPIQYPPNLRIQYRPELSLPECYDAFQEKLKAIPEAPIALSIRHIMRNNFKLRQYSVELGLSQKLLYTKSAESSTQSVGSGNNKQSAPVHDLSVCYHHPNNIAVRSCSICGMALCEACYAEYQDRWFCERCLPEDVGRQVAAPPLPGGVAYAGFGVRGLAFSIDLLLLGLLSGGIYFAVHYGMGLFMTGNSPKKIAYLLAQFVMVLQILTFHILLMRKFGGRPGQRLLGLQVVDKHGERPETAAAIVRFAYLLIACIFIFPWLGYFFIPFTKTKQGLHDRLAGTFVITKRASLKAAISWLLILSLCGGVGWQGYRMLGGWFLYMLNPSVYSPEITLKARWTKEFDQGEQLPLTSFLNRGTQSIVSTTHAVYAVDMLTGEILWQTAKLPELILENLSSETERPLLGLQHEADGETTLTRLDPANGNILWQHELNAPHSRINFDERHIVVLGDSQVSLYNLAGEQIWQLNFQDGFSPEYVAFHRGILLANYGGDTSHLMYLSRENGELLWEQKDSDFFPGYVLPDVEQHLFYTKEGEAMLFDLKSQKPLWDAPKDLEFVIGHTVDPTSGQIYLHTSRGMARQQDGELQYSYPPGFRFVGASDRFLILLQGSGGRQNTCLLLDKNSGETVQQTDERDWFTVFYLSEDKDAIYLAANSKSGGSRDNNINTSLVRLDKQGGELKEISVGRNIGMIRFKIFPQEGLVFIPLYQRIGGYLLPEM